MDTLGFTEVGIGHNRQSEDMISGDALRTSLEMKHDAIAERCNELMAAEQRLPAISDDESAGKVSDYIKQITATCKNADGARIAAKEPYLEGGRIVDGFFTKGIVDPLMALKRRIEAKLTRYLQEKAQREREERARLEREARAAEDAARREAEEKALAARTEAELERAISAEAAAAQASSQRAVAAEAANAKPAELSRTRGDYGSVASLRTAWDYEVTDQTIVPSLFLMINDAAVKAHIKARMKDKPPLSIAGVRFYEKTTAAVR